MDLCDKLSYPIYFMNMDNNKKRRNFIEKQFEKYKIKNYIRVPGVDINNFKYNFETEYDLSNKQIGCIAAHIMTILEFLKSDYDEALILEDDASLSLLPHLNFNLNEFVKTKVPKDWEIISLSNFLCNKDNKKYDKNIKLYERVNKDESCWLTTAYIINKKAAKKLIKMVFKNDTIYINPVEPGFPTYGVADDYLYALLKTYYITPSIIFPYNPEFKNNKIINDIMISYLNNGFPKLNDKKFKIIQI